jgi:hypothetical protein
MRAPHRCRLAVSFLFVRVSTDTKQRLPCKYEPIDALGFDARNGNLPGK